MILIDDALRIVRLHQHVRPLPPHPDFPDRPKEEHVYEIEELWHGENNTWRASSINFSEAAFQKLVNAFEDVADTDRDKLLPLVLEGLGTDGAHHKQHFLCEVLKIIAPEAYRAQSESKNFDPGLEP